MLENVLFLKILFAKFNISLWTVTAEGEKKVFKKNNWKNMKGYILVFVLWFFHSEAYNEI